MPSTEEQLKQILASSNGRVYKSVMARMLGISMGYLDTIGDSLKRKEEITISGGWYTIKKRRKTVEACKTEVSVIKNHKIPISDAKESIVKFIHRAGLEISKAAQIINKVKRHRVVIAIIIFILLGALFSGSAVRTGKWIFRLPDSYEEGNVAEASSSNDASSYQNSNSAVTTNDFHFTAPITRQYKFPRAEERERVIAKPKQVLKMNVAVTFYSSTPDQTDSTPFITANGKLVRDGIAASNFLAFGTRIKLPELFGDKYFVIEDRMHSRFTGRIDVWVPTREEALNQGISFTTVEIY